jgi:hypothetical protein
VAHKIICAKEMKQVGGVTAGVRWINCLSMSDKSVFSSIHATLLVTTKASWRCRRSVLVVSQPVCFLFRLQVFGGPALADIAESRGTNAGQPYGPEEQVKLLTFKRDHERGLGF